MQQSMHTGSTLIYTHMHSWLLKWDSGGGVSQGEKAIQTKPSTSGPSQSSDVSAN